MNPEPEDVYRVIRNSVTNVFEIKFREAIRLQRSSLTPKDIVPLVDEIARNSAQAVVLLYSKED